MKFVDLEFFKKIFARLVDLYGTGFNFQPFSCNEPLLHRQLPEILQIVDGYGVQTFLSSNLNVECDFEKLLTIPSVYKFVVSTSGYYQHTYSINHRGGHVKRVLKNLEKLAQCQKHDNCKIVVAFHQYRYNYEDELRYKELCEKYGFDFAPYPGNFAALDMALESMDSHTENLSANSASHKPYLLSEHILNYTPTSKYASLPCNMLDDILPLSFDGAIGLCCSIDHSRICDMGSLFELTADQIQAKRVNSEICAKCMSASFHVYTQMRNMVNKSITSISQKGRLDYLNAAFLKVSDFLDHPEYALDKLRGKKLVLYGACAVSDLLQKIMRLKNYEISEIIDDNIKLQGGEMGGVPVMSYNDAARNFNQNTVVVLCMLGLMSERLEGIKQKILGNNAVQVLELHEFIVEYA